MYAIIKTGGKQYKVSEGDVIYVEKLGVEDEAVVTFDEVLAVGEGESLKVGAPTVEGAKVVCYIGNVREQKIVRKSKDGQNIVSTRTIDPVLVKGDKVLVFHKRRRKGYRKLNGHRQQFTELVVKEIIG